MIDFGDPLGHRYRAHCSSAVSGSGLQAFYCNRLRLLSAQLAIYPFQSLISIGYRLRTNLFDETCV